MTYVCDDWWSGLEILNGQELGDFYAENTCSYYDTASAQLDANGRVLEYSRDYGDITCSEHERYPNDYDDYLEQAAAFLDERSDWYICQDHVNPHEYPVFEDNEEYELHRAEVHDDNGETTAEPTAEPETPAPTPEPTNPTILTHALPLRPHPAMSEDLRQHVARFIAERIDAGYGGVLVDPRPAHDHLITEPNPSTGLLDTWRRNWPHLFWISFYDPHINRSATARSLHSTWTP